MTVNERDYMKDSETAEAASLPRWLLRLNAFGERHAKVIITISTALVILIALAFAKHYHDRSTLERAEQEIESVGKTDDPIKNLKELKKKYEATPLAPRISFRLANMYYEEGKLDLALNEYKEFQSRHPNDMLFPLVLRSLKSLEGNIRFEQDQKDLRLKEHRLQTHPIRLPEAADPRLRWDPVPLPRPVVEIAAGTGVIKVELFEDEAPQAVAHFLKLCDRKDFDGVKVDVLNGGERLQAARKEGVPAEPPIPIEITPQAAGEGALLMVRKEGAPENLPDRFQILLKALPDLKDVTVFGVVTEGLPAALALKKDDAVKSLKVLSRRDGPDAANKP